MFHGTAVEKTRLKVEKTRLKDRGKAAVERLKIYPPLPLGRGVFSTNRQRRLKQLNGLEFFQPDARETFGACCEGRP